MFASNYVNKILFRELKSYKLIRDFVTDRNHMDSGKSCYQDVYRSVNNNLQTPFVPQLPPEDVFFFFAPISPHSSDYFNKKPHDEVLLDRL